LQFIQFSTIECTVYTAPVHSSCLLVTPGRHNNKKLSYRLETAPAMQFFVDRSYSFYRRNYWNLLPWVPSGSGNSGE